MRFVRERWDYWSPLAGGVALMAAPLAFPHMGGTLALWLFIGGAVAAVVGAVIGLQRTTPTPADHAPLSTTVKARGGGTVELEDFVSGADTFADVDELSSLSAKRGVHLPRNDGRAGFQNRPPLDH